MRGESGYYYPESFRGVCVSVVKMLSNIVLYRKDDNGKKIKKIIVPVQIGPHEKEQRARTIEERDDSFYGQLPRISVMPSGMSLNSSRVISPNTKRYWNTPVYFNDVNVEGETILKLENSIFSDYVPLPYDFTFDIKILTRNLSDLSQIIENITPLFTPKNGAIRVKEFEFLNIERDLITTLQDFSFDFSTSIDNSENRYINASTTISVAGYQYRRVKATKIVDSILCDYFNLEETDTYKNLILEE